LNKIKVVNFSRHWTFWTRPLVKVTLNLVQSSHFWTKRQLFVHHSSFELTLEVDQISSLVPYYKHLLRGTLIYQVFHLPALSSLVNVIYPLHERLVLGLIYQATHHVQRTLITTLPIWILQLLDCCVVSISIFRQPWYPTLPMQRTQHLPSVWNRILLATTHVSHPCC
jgi:hypothetical protein